MLHKKLNGAVPIAIAETVPSQQLKQDGGTADNVTVGGLLKTEETITDTSPVQIVLV